MHSWQGLEEKRYTHTAMCLIFEGFVFVDRMTKIVVFHLKKKQNIGLVNCRIKEQRERRPTFAAAGAEVTAFCTLDAGY